MNTLLREICGAAGKAMLTDVADPGAGHPPADARRRRWVRNLWLALVPPLLLLRAYPGQATVLAIFGFILTFMILDEVGKN